MTSSGSAGVEGSMDFSFGFGDANFSDRTLQLEIADDEPHRKRRRSAHTTTPPHPREKTIHINSLLLAASSQFFRKLFSNGMRESAQKLATLRIEPSDEDSFMDLLKYIYSHNLPTTLHALLHLLVIADKFEAVLCLRDCTRLLQNMPMTCESACLYLDLPPSLLMSPTVVPLIDAAKQFLVAHFKDFDKCKEEILDLSLTGIQLVLFSDDLQVTSEDDVYDSVLKWVHKHYSNLEERREILKAHLLDLVRFPFMTTPKLIEVQTCSDIGPRELAYDIVIRALYFKSEASQYQKHCLAAERGNVVSRQFVERAYKYKSVKVVELEWPQEHCIVYLHFTMKELRSIGHITSEAFHLGKQQLVFEIHKLSNGNVIEMALKAVRPAATFQVNYDISVRNDALQFLSLHTGGHRNKTTIEMALIARRPAATFRVKDDIAVRNDAFHFVSLHTGGHRNMTTFTEQEHTSKILPRVHDNPTSFINDAVHVKLELTKV